MRSPFRRTRRLRWRVALVSVVALVAAVLAGGGGPALALGVGGHPGRFVAISAFDDHTLAVAVDGTVWAWGSNDASQLGDGTFTERNTPVQVAGLTGVVGVAAGYQFSLALQGDGTVWAWGSNGSGALGDGTTDDRQSPVQVAGLAGVVEVAAGYDYALARKADGTLWAWGDNGSGQLGDGTTDPRSTPVQVPGMAIVVSVASGGSHTLAIKADGTVWAWGYNGEGQLGNGTTTSSSSPVQTSGLTDVVATAGSYSHSLAVRSDGTVWAWGENRWGQLGDGTTTNRSTPVQVPGFAGATAVAAGEHSLALKADGTLWAWGSNEHGRLGDATYTNRPSPVTVAGLSGVVAISAAYNHSVALKSDHTLWAWGRNELSVLGQGVSVYSSTPIPLSGLTGVAALSAGEWHTAALKSDGTLLTFGGNQSGELGDGTTADRKEPVPVPGLGNVTAVAASTSYTIAARSDGTVAAWGGNAYGNLGDGTTTARLTPVTVSGLTGVTAVAANNHHALAAKSDGTVWAWGWGSQGQLGDGAGMNRLTPVQAAGLNGVTAVAARFYLSTALKSDGTVWGWGSKVGDGTNVSRYTPVQLPGLTGVVAISARYYHSLALKADGTVWAWGSNFYGELGDGTTNERLAPVQVAGLTGVTAIAAGRYHSLAVKADGTVWAWGLNQSGQLGDGTYSDKLTPVQVAGLTGVTAVAADWHHSLALKSDGTVWGWGRNENGQLGESLLPWLNQPGRVRLNAAPGTPVWSAPAPDSSHQESIAFAATATEPDGESYTVTFELHSNNTYTDLLRTVTGATVASGSPSTASWTVDIAAGAYYARARAVDAAGGVSAWQPLGQIQIQVITAPPEGSVSFAGGAATTNTRSVTLALTAVAPDLAVTDMRFSDDGVTWAAWEPYQTTRNYTLPGDDGLKTVHVQFRDAAGNLSAAASATILLDTVPPTATASALAPTQSSATFSIEWTATDGNGVGGSGSGMSSVHLYYATDGGSTWIRFDGAFTASPIPFTAPAEGAYAFSMIALDAAGNAEALPGGPASVEAATVFLERPDLELPRGAVIINAGSAATPAPAVQLTILLQNAPEGAVEMRFSDDRSRWTPWESFAAERPYTLPAGHGRHRVWVEFRDGLGNYLTSAGYGMLVDLQPPQGVVVAETPPAAVGGDTSNRVRLHVLAGDIGSGVPEVRFSADGANWGQWETYRPVHEFAAPGGRRADDTIYAQFRDVAGNLSPVVPAQAPSEAAANATPPAGTMRIITVPSEKTSDDVLLVLTATGNQSPIVAMRFSADGSHWTSWEGFVPVRRYFLWQHQDPAQVRVQFRDAAGNVSAPIGPAGGQRQSAAASTSENHQESGKLDEPHS